MLFLPAFLAHRLSILFFIVTLPAIFSSPQQKSPATPPVAIRVTVDRVSVGVVVTDSAGRLVEGLRREDFQIFDNGAEQPLTGFSAVDEPAQVLVLIEAGPAVYLLQGGHLQSARELLNGLSAGDRIALVKYADIPEPVLDFTADKQAAATALENLRFNIGFGSLNLSASLAKVMDWLDKLSGKKTVVLLSTGLDTSSPGNSSSLLQRLRIGGVRVLAVSLTGELRSPPPAATRKKSSPTATSSKAAWTAQQFATSDTLLKQIAESTGGRAYFPNTASDFNSVYAEIARIVRHEYSLAFAPPARDNSVHAIEVRVRANTPVSAAAPLRVDYRQAYLAPAP